MHHEKAGAIGIASVVAQTFRFLFHYSAFLLCTDCIRGRLEH